MADVTLSAMYADGTIIRSTGFINIESWTNQDNKLTLSMHPRNNSWAIFAGAGDTSGSPKSIAVNGTSYQVLADNDQTYMPSEYKNEVVVRGSGANLRKMTRQDRSITGITITANFKELEQLRAIAEN